MGPECPLDLHTVDDLRAGPTLRRPEHDPRPEAYEDASTDTKNAHFKTLFVRRAIERKTVASELQLEVRKLLGNEPAHSGTTAGAAHRIWMNLKASLTGSEEGIVNSVEAGEDHIKAEYEDAMADQELSPAVLDVIRSNYSSIKAGHDEMRDLKRSLQA